MAGLTMRMRGEAESERREEGVSNQWKVLNLGNPFHVW